LEPGGAGKIRMEVRERTSTPDGARLTCPVTVRSLADPNRVDAVRSVTYVGPVGCRAEIRGDGEVLACAP
ncbi:MAG TPA: hypothetical protein VFQ40_01915, partial [Actinomycetota bacterium]|nr:hypothetical protein [Actinomycetota bacterium]